MNTLLLGLLVATLAQLSMPTSAQSNTALTFNGVNAYGSAPGVGGLYHNSTWEAWIRLPDYSPGLGYRAVLQRWGMYSHTAPLVDVSNGSAWGMEPCGRATSTPPAGAITVGRWHHVAVVYTTTAMTVFVDGAQTSTDPVGTCPYAGWETVLGASGYIGYGAFFRGDIDEARISNVARYTGPFVPQTRFTTDGNTVGLWHFDEGIGGAAADDSGNARHFTLHGGYAWVGGNTTISASFARFGTGCPGTGGTPTLDAASGSLPRLGSTFSVSIAGLPPATSIAAIDLGISRTQYAGFPLPLELSLWSMPGCFLYQSRDVTLGLFHTGGRASWSAVVPTDTSLAGYQLQLQAWAHDPPSNGLGIVTSNGGTATLGF